MNPYFFRSITFTKIIATNVEVSVAIIPGTITAVGFTLPYWLRYAIMDTGISCREDMFIIKKVHISLLAVTGGFPVLLHSSSFSFCSSSMAFSPAGVQAQPSPRILAIILVEIYSLAAWFPGIRGKGRK